MTYHMQSLDFILCHLPRPSLADVSSVRMSSIVQIVLYCGQAIHLRASATGTVG